jgi:hypothetical protein
MPIIPKFLRRGISSSSSQNSATTADYHRYSSDQATENDELQFSTAANMALHTINSGNDGSITSAPISVNLVPCTPQDVESNVTGIEVKQTPPRNVDGAENNTDKDKVDDDSSGAWWNLLSNKDSFDTGSVIPAQTKVSQGESASNYIQKEKMLRKKAFNRAVLGGSIRFDHTFSDESTTDLPYHYVHPASSWGMELPSKQQEVNNTIEWTPQDSSYGAAVSAFGWLPKRIRKLAESVFVVLTFAILVYLVIKIGAEISRTHSSSSGGDLDLDDDDHYIAHNNKNGGDDDGGDEKFRFI